ADRCQQWPGEEELVGEDVVADRGPAAVSGWVLLPLGGVMTELPLGGDPQQLLRVVPLIEGAGLVDALVALEPDEPGTSGPRDGLGELGLADSRRALDEERLAEPLGEEDGRGDGVAGEVAGCVKL